MAFLNFLGRLFGRRKVHVSEPYVPDADEIAWKERIRKNKELYARTYRPSDDFQYSPYVPQKDAPVQDYEDKLRARRDRHTEIDAQHGYYPPVPAPAGPELTPEQSTREAIRRINAGRKIRKLNYDFRRGRQ